VDAGVAQQERDAVGADAEKGGMTERKEPGIAEQEIEAERRDGGDQPIGQELDLIEADIRRKQCQDHENERRRRCQHQLRAIGDYARLRFHHALPNRPVGLTISTTAAIR
jgi:hypothetical protein